MLVLIKAPQVESETMSSPEETMADIVWHIRFIVQTTLLHPMFLLLHPHVPAASVFFIRGNAMNGAFQGLHH